MGQELACGCIRNVRHCAVAEQLWEDVADAHHELTLVRRRLEAAPSLAAREPLMRQEAEWLALYEQSKDLHGAHFAVSEEEPVQVQLH